MPEIENGNPPIVQPASAAGLTIPEPIKSEAVVTPDITPAAPETKVDSSNPDGSTNTPAATEPAQKLPDNTIDFDDFNAILENRAPVKPKIEAPKEEPKTKVDFTPKTVDVNPATTPKPAERDYTGFTEQEVALLKKTSNETFAYIKPQLMELRKIKELNKARDEELASLKAGKAVLPDNYYEHSEGHLLDPTWKAAATNLNLAASVQRHWQEQMVNIRKGLDWSDLATDANGNIVTVPGKKANAESEAAVSTWLQQSVVQYAQIQNQVLNIQNGFKSRYTNAVAAVEKATKDHFAAFDDPKNVALNKTKTDLLSMVPKEFQKHPMTELALRGITAALAFQEELKQVKAGLTSKAAEVQKTQENIKKAGPNDSNMTGGTSGKVEAVPDFADFQRALMGDV